MKEIKCDDMLWIHLAKDRIQGQAVKSTVMSLAIP
jgi:hypothetical protein